MKSIVKKCIAILGGLIVVLIIAIFVTAKVNDRNFPSQLGVIIGTINLAFTNNSTLRIKMTGVLNEDGSIAAMGKSVGIAAETTEGYTIGIIGTIKDGTLDIKLPPIPSEYLVDAADGSCKIATLGIFYTEEGFIVLEDGQDTVVFVFVDRKSEIQVKGWNFVSSKDNKIYRYLNSVYDKGYKWIHYGE